MLKLPELVVFLYLKKEAIEADYNQKTVGFTGPYILMVTILILTVVKTVTLRVGFFYFKIISFIVDKTN